jgi:hypothetical protein
MSTTAPASAEKDHDSDAAVGWTENRWIVSGDRARIQTHQLEA